MAEVVRAAMFFTFRCEWKPSMACMPTSCGLATVFALARWSLSKMSILPTIVTIAPGIAREAPEFGNKSQAAPWLRTWATHCLLFAALFSNRPLLFFSWQQRASHFCRQVRLGRPHALPRLGYTVAHRAHIRTPCLSAVLAKPPVRLVCVAFCVRRCFCAPFPSWCPFQ